MTRVMTIKELVLWELNRQLAEEGSEVRVVSQRPQPQLATSEGVVVPMRAIQPEERLV
jgi:hypothetical protein